MRRSLSAKQEDAVKDAISTATRFHHEMGACLKCTY